MFRLNVGVGVRNATAKGEVSLCPSLVHSYRPARRVSAHRVVSCGTITLCNPVSTPLRGVKRYDTARSLALHNGQPYETVTPSAALVYIRRR